MKRLSQYPSHDRGFRSRLGWNEAIPTVKKDISGIAGQILLGIRELVPINRMPRLN